MMAVLSMIRSADFTPAVRAVVEEAFGRRDEADLVERLCESDGIICSLAAVEGDAVIGHVLFSAVRVTGERGGTLASLAPLAVRVDRQRRGVGTALVKRGIEACAAAGYRGLIVVGHPEYYARFGFAHATVGHLQTPYAGDAFMGLELAPGAIARLRGAVVYPRAFGLL